MSLKHLILSLFLFLNILSTSYGSGFLSSFSDFMRDRISGLYYTTSVAGYGSSPKEKATYLKDFLANTSNEDWKFDTIDYTISADASTEISPFYLNELYTELLDPNDYTFINEHHQFCYAFQETRDSVKIVTLNHFIRSQFTEKHTGGHTIYISNKDTDFLKSPDKSPYFIDTDVFISEIISNHANKKIEIHTMISYKISTTAPLMEQFTSLSTTPLSIMFHNCYAKININSKHQNMTVKIVDPTFDPDKPILRDITITPTPLPLASEQLFKKIVQFCHLKLKKLSYHYRGDQVLNFHDCSRFSTIYLQSELEGNDCLNLTNYDIYRGFKTLEENDYETIQRRPLNAPDTSFFVTHVTNPVRYVVDYFMNTFC